MTNEKMKKRVMELLLVLAGNVLMSIGVGAFVIPEELMSGGATGLGLLPPTISTFLWPCSWAATTPLCSWWAHSPWENILRSRR